MSSRVQLDGLQDLIDAMRRIPDELKAEATDIVMQTATSAKATIDSVYKAHVKTGALSRGLSLKVMSAGRFGVVAEVKSNGRLAWLFDNGSAARHYTGTDKRGRVFNNADRGKMWGKASNPPMHIVSGTAARSRRAMHQKLAELLRQHGFQVTGTP